MKTLTKKERELRDLQAKQKAQAKRENTNWNAKFYREKSMQTAATASFEQSFLPPPVEVRITKKERNAALKQAAKVRGNKTAPTLGALPKYVMVNGIPHTVKEGRLVPMTLLPKKKVRSKKSAK